MAYLESRRRYPTQPVAREWPIYGQPTCELYTDGSGLLTAAYFQIPMDVPSKPRTTRAAAAFNPANRNYVAWKRVWTSALAGALAMQGVMLDVGVENTLFSAILALEDKKVGRRRKPTRPLRAHFFLTSRLQGDVDNREKALWDAGNGFLYDDDARIQGGSHDLVSAGANNPLCEMAFHYLPLENRNGLINKLIGQDWRTVIRGMEPLTNKRKGLVAQ